MHWTTVRTVEELKEARRNRAHGIIMVEGELASNLLASGIIRNCTDENGWQVALPRSLRTAQQSPMYSVFDVLHTLSQHHQFQVVQGALGKKIRIEPMRLQRREGN
jgi:hypothetical protein